jgi:tetratricopeptide (TPR) repeat protein
MPVVKNAAKPASVETTISDFIHRDFGHMAVASDDRIFINVFRRTVVTEMGLPSSAITVITNEEQIYKIVRELCVRKKVVLLFVQRVINNNAIDDIIKMISWKINNCKVVLVTTESEVHQLALLREQNIAENWITKPIVINQLLEKVASIIKPHGKLSKLIKAAEEYLKQGSFRYVLTICRRIFETDPDCAVAYMLMGDAFRGLDQVDEMIEAYEHATYIDSLFLAPMAKLVEYFHEKNDRDKELQYLEKLDAMSPLNTERKMDIAKIQLELGNGEEAKSTFESVMKMTTKKVAEAISEAATKIGTIYAQNNNPEALTYFRKAIEAFGNNLNKSHMHLFNNLGIMLRKDGKWQDAIAEYKKAVSISPDDEILYYNMALAYDDGGEHDNASNSMRNAIRINPDLFKKDHVTSYNAGKVFAGNREKEQAVVFLNNALALNPEYESAKVLLQSLTGPAARS